MQSAINKYGIDNFTFKIAEFCDKDSCLLIEQNHLMLNNAVEDGYNICPVAGNCSGRKFSKETKEQMRQKKLGRKCSDETKRKMSESRHKFFELNGVPKGKVPSLETRKKLSENSARFWLGKKRSANDITKMSKPKKFKNGISPHCKSIIALCDGKTYCFNSYIEAGRSNIFDRPIFAGNLCKIVDTNKSHGKINNKKVYWKSL